MNSIDIFFIVPLLYGVFKGVYKGFVMEAAALIGVVLGVYIAKLYSPSVADLLHLSFEVNPTYSQPLAFLLVFIGVILFCHVIAKIIDRSLKFMMLAWLNKLLGGLFGFIKYAIILSIILNVFLVFNTNGKFLGKDKREGSLLYKPLEKIVPEIMPYMHWDDFKNSLPIKEI